MKNIILLFALFFSQIALADKPISFSGRVMDVSNNAIEDSSTKFNIKISNNASCILYDEDFTIDMTGSNGYFKLALSGGQPSFNPSGLDIFRAKPYTCKDGSNWSASSSDLRKSTLTVKVGDAPAVTFASDTINASAYANEANYLNGKAITDLLQISATSTQANIDSLTAKLTAILDLVNGNNNFYAKDSFVQSSLSAKQAALGYTPMNPSNNLSELLSKDTARTNLGLGTLALKSGIVDTDITSLSYSKLTGLPTDYTPKAHTHVINDVTGLATAISNKIDKSSIACSSTQVPVFVSASGVFQCFEITTGGDLTGNVGAVRVTKIQNIPVSNAVPNTGDTLVYDGTKWAPTAASGSGSNSTFKVYAGEIIMFPGTCPAGTLLADGSELNQSQNIELYNVFGCTFGVGGNCPTQVTFKLPDYRGYFIRGADTTGLNPINTTQLDTVKSHTHSITDPGHAHGINDPGHSHSGNVVNYNRFITNYDVKTGGDYSNLAFLSPSGYPVGSTNYPVDASAQTGITIKSATTGITATNSNDVTAIETRPKNKTVNYCIRQHNL